MIFNTKCFDIIYDKKPCVALYMQDTLKIIGKEKEQQLLNRQEMLLATVNHELE